MPDSLPSWSLADLYPAADAPEIDKDITAVRADAEALNSTWKGRVHEADAAAFAGLVRSYEKINEKLGRLSSFADLAFAADMTGAETGRQAQMMRELDGEISALLVFVELEIARLDDSHIETLMAHPEVAALAPWLRLVRAWRPHQLADDLEKMLIEKQPSGRSAWVRLFDETAASLRFKIDDSEVGEAEILDMMQDLILKPAKRPGSAARPPSRPTAV